jgi:hypothetical protein
MDGSVKLKRLQFVKGKKLAVERGFLFGLGLIEFVVQADPYDLIGDL